MNHKIEPESIAPRPRKTGRRLHADPSGTLLARLGLILLGIGGAGLGVSLCLVGALASSTPTNGRIMAIKMPPPGALASQMNPELPRTGLFTLPPPAPRLEYSFRVAERTIQDAMPLTPEQVRRMPQTGHIPVRTIPFFVDRWHSPILPNDSLWRSVGLLALLTIAVNGLFIALIRSRFARRTI